MIWRPSIASLDEGDQPQSAPIYGARNKEQKAFMWLCGSHEGACSHSVSLGENFCSG